MGIVLDMIGQGGERLSGKKKSEGMREKQGENNINVKEDIDKENAFSIRESKSKKFRASMSRQPKHRNKGSFGGPRVKMAK